MGTRYGSWCTGSCCTALGPMKHEVHTMQLHVHSTTGVARMLYAGGWRRLHAGIPMRALPEPFLTPWHARAGACWPGQCAGKAAIHGDLDRVCRLCSYAAIMQLQDYAAGVEGCMGVALHVLLPQLSAGAGNVAP